MKKIKIAVIGIGLLSMGLPSVAQVRDWGCDDETQQRMMEPVSLYQENMKQYKTSKDARYCVEAYPQWKEIVANCPKQSKTSISMVPTS